MHKLVNYQNAEISPQTTESNKQNEGLMGWWNVRICFKRCSILFSVIELSVIRECFYCKGTQYITFMPGTMGRPRGQQQFVILKPTTPPLYNEQCIQGTTRYSCLYEQTAGHLATQGLMHWMCFSASSEEWRSEWRTLRWRKSIKIFQVACSSECYTR